MSLPDGPRGLPVPSVALVILDGWGLAPPGPGNAVELASTPVFDELWSRYPHTQLSASGRDVGLPDGQMGNSEVGHLNLGAGAVVKQDLARIDDAIADGSFFENDALRAACAAARAGSGRLHAMGLVSDGGVHSGFTHLRALIELATREQVPDLVVHAFTDGRDTLPDSGAGFVRELEGWLGEHGGRIGTVGGRYYAMDRDRRWDRTERAYDAIVRGNGAAGSSAEDAVRASYDAGVTDEFIEPVVIAGYEGMSPGDAAIHFNFRPDRARQLVRAVAAAHDLHRVPGGLAVPRGLPSARPGDDARPRAGGGGRAPAARRRDREVRPRDLLLQRGARAGVGGGGALPRRLAARRPHL
jgi:2,3-bisphosphoglycerate-independent phosphoglycerate mutase